VDAPELGDAGYEEAKDYLSSLLVLSGTGAGEGEENIRIERQGIDKYNRTLAWIYSGETLINKEIIDNGYGEVFEYDGTNCSLVA
jgi:endonuclease YncB( thermonuclease family)